MCWVALDRAIALGEQLPGDRAPSWEATRHEIAEAILTEGWSDAARSKAPVKRRCL
jgi:GH15 family glucan-1,4-alpha-glucosidase